MGVATAWEELTIANDFVFCKAMLDEDLCREVLEAVLGVEIDRVEHVDRQHVLDASYESKAVRLDVYLRDGEGTVYDVEMQACHDAGLPRRARYYHAQIATEQLERGDPYRVLPDSYSIFFCLFDPVGCGERLYSFENRCTSHLEMPFDDGMHTVLLCAASPRQAGLSDRLNDLLDYIGTGQVRGELPERVDRRVHEVISSPDWRRQYMLLEWRDQDNIEKGRQMGREEGADQLARLVSALLAQGRVSDVELAVSDVRERRRLAQELGIEVPLA